jgi:hypothetical protein
MLFFVVFLDSLSFQCLDKLMFGLISDFMFKNVSMLGSIELDTVIIIMHAWFSTLREVHVCLLISCLQNISSLCCFR